MQDRESPLASYLRTYSQIEGLQPAYTLRYCLFAEADGYRLEVCESGAGKAVCHMAGISAAAAGKLLRYLYENGVPAGQAAEVLQDVSGAILHG